jgi:peptidoglycan/xylan/chitin deacetylase (PgdA/CDA1 family)
MTRLIRWSLRAAPARVPLAALALTLLLLTGCSHGHSPSGAGATSSAKPGAPASSAQLTRLRLHTVGPAAALLRAPRTVRFTFRFAGGAPSRWNWRVVSAYGDVVAWGVNAVTAGAGGGAVTWAGRTRSGAVADPGEYLVKIGPGARYHADMTTIGRVRFEPPVQARVYRRLPAAGRRVALTFDDGGSKTAWYWILRELEAGHAKGTFFPIGLYVGSYAAREARLTIKDHMAIGNHTWSHQDLPLIGDAQVRAQLRRADGVWWRTLRASPVPYLRPPNGDYTARVVALAGRLGYSRIVLWDVDAGDDITPKLPVSTIVHNVLDYVRPGSIILMHIRGRTPKALPLIIAGLHARGYQMVTLPALFKAAGVP